MSEKKITIFSDSGIRASFLQYGARLTELWVKGSKGEERDVVLGFKTLVGYLNAEETYFGCIVGRYANRIANGTFTIDKDKYRLDCNNGPNSLHGGYEGFHLKTWEVDAKSKNSVTFSIFSPHLEGGFPGDLKVSVTYSLKGNDLEVEYHGTSDRKSILNLTQHSYFNLNGEGSGSVGGHLLRVYSKFYTPVNTDLIPEGHFENTEHSPFDFSSYKRLDTDWDSAHPQMKLGNGYDHNYVLKTKNSNEVIKAASIYSPDSGIKMDVHTTQPGMQLYCANWLSGNDMGKSGIPYTARTAFCLETQHFPDTPNQGHFPDCYLSPGSPYKGKCIYSFGLIS